MQDYCPPVPWAELAQHAEEPWCNDERFNRYHGDGSEDFQEFLRLYLDLEDSQRVEGRRLVFKMVPVERPVTVCSVRVRGEEEDAEEQESESEVRSEGGEDDGTEGAERAVGDK